MPGIVRSVIIAGVAALALVTQAQMVGAIDSTCRKMASLKSE